MPKSDREYSLPGVMSTMLADSLEAGEIPDIDEIINRLSISVGQNYDSHQLSERDKHELSAKFQECCDTLRKKNPGSHILSLIQLGSLIERFFPNNSLDMDFIFEGKNADKNQDLLARILRCRYQFLETVLRNEESTETRVKEMNLCRKRMERIVSDCESGYFEGADLELMAMADEQLKYWIFRYDTSDLEEMRRENLSLLYDALDKLIIEDIKHLWEHEYKHISQKDMAELALIRHLKQIDSALELLKIGVDEEGEPIYAKHHLTPVSLNTIKARRTRRSIEELITREKKANPNLVPPKESSRIIERAKKQLDRVAKENGKSAKALPQEFIDSYLIPPTPTRPD